MAPMKIASIVLAASCGLLVGTSCAFQAPIPPSSRVSQQRSTPTIRSDSALHMGLRTFIKTKLGRNEKDDDTNGTSASEKKPITSTTPTKKKKKPKAPSTTTANVSMKKPKGLNIPTQPPAQPQKQIGGLSREQVTAKSSNKESRLPPLRQESVKDRLNRVRSGQMTDDEKQAFLKTALSAGDSSTSRKPLRQELADESRPMNSTSNATPMPKDSLLSNMARGWGNGKNNTDLDYASIRNYQNGAQLEDQKKKREYFDMVTNPDRFHTYKSSMVTAPGETDKVDPTVHDGLVIPEMGNEEEKDDARGGILEEEVIEEIREYEQVAGVEGDLGTRLENAAHALEEAAKQREKERKEKEARMEQQRQEQKKRLAEIQKKQQLEMEKRELELKAKKREEEEAKALETERKRKEEEVRRRKLEEAQDAYWAKKLAKEKQERVATMSTKQKAEFEKHEVQAEEKAIEITEYERKALEAEKRAMESAAEKQRENAVEARIDVAAADYLSKETTTKPSDAYEAIREKKRRESERARDEQIARLKALNSPLPAPRTSPTMSPVVAPASFAARSASELSNLKNQPQPAPAPAQMPKSEPTIAELINDTNDIEVEEVTVVESSDKSSFFSRVIGKKESSAPKAAPERKRVVRQQLPLGDEEDDFDTFDRNGPNRKMSIGDAMNASGESSSGGDQEQRSKMWGVDMSRIAKSLEDENK